MSGCGRPFAILSLALLLPAACAAAPAPERKDSFKAVPLPENIAAQAAVLEVSGRIGRDRPVFFDLPSLAAFPQTSFEDIDPWDGNRHGWEGVALLPLLIRIGMEESAESLEITAENNYKASIRISDLKRGVYLLALSMDGRPLAERRERPRRGSLQIAIEFSAQSGMPLDVYKHQLVWQVRRIMVR